MYVHDGDRVEGLCLFVAYPVPVEGAERGFLLTALPKLNSDHLSPLFLIFQQDYREDAREYLLKVSGKSEDEIDRYFIPKTAAEKQQSAIKQKVSSEQLHETVATLEKEVDRLKWKVFGSNTTDDKKASAKD